MTLPAGGDPIHDLATVNAQLARLGIAPVCTDAEAYECYDEADWPRLVELSRARLLAGSRQLRGIV